MTILAALVLALAAGVTEILPVSGSGHLFLLAKLLGVQAGSAAFRGFRAALCFGVGFGGLLYYRTQLLDMVRENLVLLGLHRPTTRQRGEPFGKRLGLLLLPATLPMAAALLLNGLRQRMETGDYTLIFVGLLFCLTGTALYFAGRNLRGKRSIFQTTLQDGLSAGLAQIVTLFPGVSRSGVTLLVLLRRGLEPPAAVELVGLMGVPVFFGAGVVQLFTVGEGTGAPAAAPYLLLGFSLAALSAFFTLRLFTDLMARRRLTGFAYWSWGAGILSLILYLLSA